MEKSLIRIYFQSLVHFQRNLQLVVVVNKSSNSCCGQHVDSTWTCREFASVRVELLGLFFCNEGLNKLLEQKALLKETSSFRMDKILQWISVSFCAVVMNLYFPKLLFQQNLFIVFFRYLAQKRSKFQVFRGNSYSPFFNLV